MLPCIEVETGPAPSRSVIWLHGLGADGHDFEPVVPLLGLPPALAVRFVFPHAPAREVTVNGGMVMRAWYDIRHMDLSREEDEPGIRASQEAVEALIRREVSRGTALQSMVLAGFSQGGATALQTGLRQSDRLAGVLALSAYLPLAGTVATERSQANAEVPIFLGHGLQDAVVPFALGTASRDRLRELGHPVSWHQYPLSHSVSLDELRDVGHWLTDRLG